MPDLNFHFKKVEKGIANDAPSKQNKGNKNNQSRNQRKRTKKYRQKPMTAKTSSWGKMNKPLTTLIRKRRYCQYKE